jgi:hypothetical protein
MKNRLSRDTSREILGKVRASGGSTDEYRFNHEGCPAGEDTRGRLYAKITEDRKLLLLHCFNCGKSGAVRYSAGLGKPKEGTREAAMSDARKSSFEIVDTEFQSLLPFTGGWPSQYFYEDCDRYFKLFFKDHFKVSAYSILQPQGVQAYHPPGSRE